MLGNKKLMALIGMILIVSLPVYSSFAMASYIQVESVHGNDDIGGYLRDTDDAMTVEVKAFVEGDDIVSTDQVRYGGSGSSPRNPAAPGAQFNNCIFAESYYLCSYSTSAVSHFTNPRQLQLYLYDDSAKLAASTTAAVYFDELEPVVESFEIAPPVVAAGNVDFKFSVRDYACNITNQLCFNKCSGIERVELLSGNYSAVVDVNGTAGECRYEGLISVPLLSIAPEAVGDFTKTKAAVLTVYDNFGRVASQLKALNIDTTLRRLPAIKNLRVLADGAEVNYVPEGGSTAEVIVDVSGYLDAESAKADLHEMNINAPADYFDKKGLCVPSGADSYSCSWPGIKILLNETVNAQLRFTAANTLGNATSAVFTRRIGYDATAPAVSSIKSNYEGADATFMGSATDITVELLESGSGFYSKELYLDLSQVNSNLSDVRADNCSAAGNSSWSCYFYNVEAVEEGVKTIAVLPSSADDVGNKVGGELAKQVIVDLTPPAYAAHSIRHAGEGEYDFIKTGDSLNIVVKVNEANQLANAYADLSSIIEGAAEVLADNCTKSGNVWSCSWATTPIDMQGAIHSSLKFYFMDAVENSMLKDIPINVVGYTEAGAAVDYWTSSASCMPSMLDRMTTSLISTRSFCHVTLSPKGPNQEVLSINMESCVAGDSGFLSSSELMNNQKGSVEPYIKLTFAQAEAKFDSLKITCPLKIISRAGDLLTSQPETESVNIEIKFYNNPAGEVSENLKDKIKGVKDSTDGIWEIIGWLKKIMDYAEMACRLWGALNNIIVAFKGLTTILGSAEQALVWFPPGSKAVGIARTQACTITEAGRESAKEGYASTFNTLCNFVNCKMSKAIDPANKDSKAAKWGKNLGGGGGMDLNNYPLGANLIKDLTGKSPNEYMDVKQSLVLSTVTLCVPGIVYNLDKYRQVQCVYGACLLSVRNVPGAGAAAGGVPLSMCEEQKSYFACKYVVGQIFRAIPFVSVFNHYSNLIRNALTDPLSAIGAVVGMTCQPQCISGNFHWPHHYCAWAKILAMLGEAVEDVMGLADKGWKVEHDYCEVFDEMYDDFKSESKKLDEDTTASGATGETASGTIGETTETPVSHEERRNVNRAGGSLSGETTSENE